MTHFYPLFIIYLLYCSQIDLSVKYYCLAVQLWYWQSVFYQASPTLMRRFWWNEQPKRFTSGALKNKVTYQYKYDRLSLKLINSCSGLANQFLII